MKLPNHIAIIMDGNGRWGVKKYNSRLIGHRYGVKNIKKIILHCLKLKIKNLSLYALSYDNLKKRPKSEIKNIFNIFLTYFNDNIDFFTLNKISIKFIGEKKNIPLKIKSLIKKAEKIYLSNKANININVAFNYSSKKEIIQSVKQVQKNNKLVLNERNISNFLYTRGINDPDILIRTGSHKRLSDFFLWQSSYTELFFLDKMWPDFTSRDLNSVLLKFYKIQRNYGK
jgi:undecaprenyl diphosphate synthase